MRVGWNAEHYNDSENEDHNAYGLRVSLKLKNASRDSFLKAIRTPGVKWTVTVEIPVDSLNEG